MALYRGRSPKAGQAGPGPASASWASPAPGGKPGDLAPPTARGQAPGEEGPQHWGESRKAPPCGGVASPQAATRPEARAASLSADGDGGGQEPPGRGRQIQRGGPRGTGTRRERERPGPRPGAPWAQGRRERKHEADHLASGSELRARTERSLMGHCSLQPPRCIWSALLRSLLFLGRLKHPVSGDTLAAPAPHQNDLDHPRLHPSG